jgi:hypothetical protein
MRLTAQTWLETPDEPEVTAASYDTNRENLQQRTRSATPLAIQSSRRRSQYSHGGRCHATALPVKLVRADHGVPLD